MNENILAEIVMHNFSTDKNVEISLEGSVFDKLASTKCQYGQKKSP